ncbi:hypothetical protein ACIQVT_01640 [Streptomyces sp. NPDC100445]|uniref:hypothetical protein n=1 Tax=Streptomyces sp. NPDC100445 TaxID=3366102 RepID=UPI0037FC327A
MRSGASIGTAVLATVAASGTASPLREHKNRGDALTGGFRLAYALSATFVPVSLLVALRTSRSDAPAVERAPSDATATAG